MMKKIIYLLTLSISLWANEKMLQSIYDNILIQNVNETLKSAKQLQQEVQNANQTVLQKEFVQLVSAWKKVETFYLAADFNEDAIDVPRYIDVFHNLKEDLHEQMQRVIDSKEDVAIEMYKNSFKTMNALEYVLFTKGFDKRKQAITQMIIDSIISHLEEIKEYYKNDSSRFLSEFKWANDVIINMLIDSSFKLRDWRVGDIAGLSRKYEGSADNRRAEYYLSGQSTVAIKAILQTHKMIMDAKIYDFGDMLKENGFEKEVQLIIAKIDKALDQLVLIQNENFEDKKVAILYSTLDELHRAYYITLVNAVGVSTKILDADGD